VARSIDMFACRRSAIGNPFRPKRAENAWESQGFRKYPVSSESAIVSRSRASATATVRGCGTDERWTRSRNAALSANCSTSRAGAETDGKRCWSSEGSRRPRAPRSRCRERGQRVRARASGSTPRCRRRPEQARRQGAGESTWMPRPSRRRQPFPRRGRLPFRARAGPRDQSPLHPGRPRSRPRRRLSHVGAY
jgi:hypothetical protein